MEPSDTFAKLAEISHSIFTNRQTNEWKVSFSFWIALGLANWLLLTVKHDALPRTSTCVIICFAVLLFALYFYFQIFVSRLNQETAQWRYYYMGRAAGLDPKQPIKVPLSAYSRNPWFFLFVPFTALLLALTVWIALGRLVS